MITDDTVTLKESSSGIRVPGRFIHSPSEHVESVSNMSSLSGKSSVLCTVVVELFFKNRYLFSCNNYCSILLTSAVNYFNIFSTFLNYTILSDFSSVFPSCE